MATALSMPSRPPMDRASSFDASSSSIPRSRSTPPFATSFEHPHHTRANSSSSNHSPYIQPPSLGYFPPNFNQAWATTALPASAFYPSPATSAAFQQFQPTPFAPGFQQSQPDFNAWATAYGHMMNYQAGYGGGSGSMTPPPPAAHAPFRPGHDRRRTNSGPSTSGGHFDHQAYPPLQQIPPNHPHHKPTPAPGGFHPYKRSGPTPKPSRENVGAVAPSIPRSASTPNALAKAPPADVHKRTGSMDAGPKRPDIPARAASAVDDHDRDFPPLRSASPAHRPVTRSQTPLQPGSIANNAGNARPSPLSQSSSPAEDIKPAKGGLRSRLKASLGPSAASRAKSSAPHLSTPKPTSTLPSTTHPGESPSQSSTRSSTPPMTPPQDDLAAPLAPFAVHHPAALGSETSLAESQRTATAEDVKDAKKGKSLFRMRNMSTDNISLSSTVSSASMMIRKMGSIGKLARRNSLMGISKIFKDKPKDEDAALPEMVGKKEKKMSKKEKKAAAAAAAAAAKSEAAPAEVSFVTGDSVEHDEDRSLAGLSPAAKLARQHTLKSRAEAAAAAASPTGEPTWDKSTLPTRANGELPSIDSVVNPARAEVLHIKPRTTSTIVRAVNVAETEYDSEDDSSDGETVEDVTVQLARTGLGRTKLSEEADREFQAKWGGAYIDRNAVPKKGILKHSISLELASTAAMQRQRSNSNDETKHAHVLGPLTSPPADPHLIDGLHHPSPSPAAEHLEFSFDTHPDFDQKMNFPYSNPAANTSAPTLSLYPALGREKAPPAVRSMTAPAAARHIIWAPQCAVYQTYDGDTYDRRSEPATCNRLTPELALQIKQELNAFKLEMPVHPSSRVHTHYFACASSLPARIIADRRTFIVHCAIPLTHSTPACPHARTRTIRTIKLTYLLCHYYIPSRSASSGGGERACIPRPCCHTAPCFWRALTLWGVAA